MNQIPVAYNVPGIVIGQIEFLMKQRGKVQPTWVVLADLCKQNSMLIPETGELRRPSYCSRFYVVECSGTRKVGREHSHSGKDDI